MIQKMKRKLPNQTSIDKEKIRIKLISEIGWEKVKKNQIFIKLSLETTKFRLTNISLIMSYLSIQCMQNLKN